MTKTSERLKIILAERNLKQVDVINLCKKYENEFGETIRKNDLSQYISGKVTPGQRKLTILSLALNVSEAWLMGYDVSMNRDGIELYQMAKKKIPLIGAVACGTPILAHENIEREVSCPDDIDADFCLRCRGDSMTGARIMDGDIVFIHAQDDVDDGQIAVVAIPTAEGEAEATLKRVYHNPDGSVTLMAENPLYRPLVLRDARIEGRAVAFLSKVV